MNKFFGKRKEDKDSPNEALKKLKDIRDLLGKKQEFTENKIRIEIQNAKNYGIKNKRMALQALARKKRLEKQLQQSDGILTTIEFQIEALENATTNTEIIKAMKQASSVLKASNQNIDVDKVNNLMDDIAEQQDISKEIVDAIASPIGFGHDIDESELLAELELLQENDLKTNLLNIDTPKLLKLPLVPIHEVEGTSKSQKVKTSEDKELDALKNWAS